MVILLLVIILFSVFMINGIIEDISVRNQVEEFKSRGVYLDKSGSTKYFTVKAREGENTTRHIKDGISDYNVGSKADIYVTSRNPLGDSALIGWISKKTWIGHTALVYDDYGKKTIEITGSLSPEDNVVRIFPNTWISNAGQTPQVALLRIKDTTEKERQRIIEYAEKQMGKPYNYSFLFNRNNSFYCSDLVSRAVASVGINVNYDYLATTGSDMIVSPNTYLIYYQETIIIDGVVTHEVYYLVE